MRAVLITGASTGIGRACALRLAASGFEVFAGVRRHEDAASLRAEGDERVRPVTLDVTDGDAIRSVVEEVADATGEHGLAGLVNNAGVVVASPLECVPLDDLRWQLEVNTIGALAMIQSALPLLRRAGGRIVNISSISGRVALPMVGAYAMSKFAMEAMNDALRRELRGDGVAVVSVEPGAVRTPIWVKSIAGAEERIDSFDDEAAERYGARMSAMRTRASTGPDEGAAPDAVARVVAAVLTCRRPPARRLVGRDARLLRAVDAILPARWVDALVASRLRRRLDDHADR